VANIDSQAINDAVWWKLAKRANELLHDQAVDDEIHQARRTVARRSI
jgi:L-asparaginase/Glu-tRNA(Gln) amidotransferase subunit D